MPKAIRRDSTEPADDLVRLYLDEIGRHPLLTKDDECTLAQRIEAGGDARAALEGDQKLSRAQRDALSAAVGDGEEATRRFVHANLRLVVSIARRYQRSGLPLLDLVQEGNLGLMHAVEKFDWRKGFKFSTYATWWIRQAIQRGISNSLRTIRLPVHAADRLQHIRAVRRELEAQAGRRVSEAELAAACGLTEQEVRELMAREAEPRSLSELLSDGSDTELVEFIADPDAADPLEHAARAMLSGEVRSVLASLAPSERDVLVLRFGLESGQPLSTGEIAERLDMTGDVVRHVERRAMAKLRHPSRHCALDGFLATG
ncbi:MAG: sigma-70 family RNA polymerase sigma factor [Acidimicrobiia bacterium]